jgi:hypothetical protein
MALYDVIAGRHGRSPEVAVAFGVAFGYWALDSLMKHNAEYILRHKKEWFVLPRPGESYFMPDCGRIEDSNLMEVYNHEVVGEYVPANQPIALNPGIHVIPELVLTFNTMYQVCGTILLTKTSNPDIENNPMSRLTAEKFGWAFGMWAAHLIAAADVIAGQRIREEPYDFVAVEESSTYGAFMLLINSDERLYKNMRRNMKRAARRRLNQLREMQARRYSLFQLMAEPMRDMRQVDQKRMKSFDGSQNS